jgi:hypothetical protein
MPSIIFKDDYLGYVSKHHPGNIRREKLGSEGWAVRYRDLLTFRLGPLIYQTTAEYCAAPPPFGSIPAFIPEDKLRLVAENMEIKNKGFMIITGLSAAGPEIPGWSWKRHYPTLILKNKWHDFDGYLSSLRSTYRRKVTRSLDKCRYLKIATGIGGSFGLEHYRFYKEMVLRANNPQRLLPLEFFRQLPINHRYLFINTGHRCLGWVLLIPDGGDLWFAQPAYDVESRNEYGTYFNLLSETIRYAVNNGYKKIFFGQESITSKASLGAEPQERYILVRHSNSIINKAIKNTKVFNYRGCHPLFNPFKDLTNYGV